MLKNNSKVRSMEEVDKIVIDDLNQLVTICNDGKYGYQAAAEDADSAVLRAMFAGYSTERARFSEQLSAEIQNLGGNPDQGGGPFAAINRAWTDLKTAIAAKDNKAVLGACISGEQAAIKAYTAVLKKNQVSREIRGILNQQRSSIEETLSKVESLYETIES
jgi:uncharacterized protein (TIGR02284 family)